MMMKKMTKPAVAFATVVAVASLPVYATAVSVTKIDKTAQGATYTFALKVDPGTSVEVGDFVTIYNFFGLVDGSVKAPEGWTFSSEQFGKTAMLNGYPLVLPVDVPGTPNITLTATKALQGGGPEATFTAETRVSKTVAGMYSTQVTRPTTMPVNATPPAAGEQPNPMLTKEARIGLLTTPDFRADPASGLKSDISKP